MVKISDNKCCMQVFQDMKCMYVYWLKMNICCYRVVFLGVNICVYSILFLFNYSVRIISSPSSAAFFGALSYVKPNCNLPVYGPSFILHVNIVCREVHIM